MQTVKGRITEVIESLPDDATYEEIMRELAFERMVKRGLEDSKILDLLSVLVNQQRRCSSLGSVCAPVVNKSRYLR